MEAKNKKAFSLAEVLIILMFIGIALMMATNIIKLPKKNQPSLKELWKKDFVAIVRSYAAVYSSNENNANQPSVYQPNANQPKISQPNTNNQSDNKPNVQNEDNLSEEEVMEIINKFVQSYNNGETPKISDFELTDNATKTKNESITATNEPINIAKDSITTATSEPIINVKGNDLDKLTKGLDISKFCGPSLYICGVSPQVSVKKSYKTLANGYLPEEDLSQNQFMLANGGNVYTRIGTGGIIDIWVDVNGYKKGPNTLGRDLFGVVVIDNKVIPMGNILSSADSNKKATCGSTDTYVPRGGSGRPLDYAGASCSMTILLEE